MYKKFSDFIKNDGVNDGVFNGINNFLYHGTSLKNAKNIIKNGFTQETYWSDKETAEDYANSYNQPVLIKINKDEIINLLEPNFTLINFYEEHEESEDEYKEGIENWNNSEKTVEDSLKIFGSAILQPTHLEVNNENIIKLY
jgi:hypothetical protein